MTEQRKITERQLACLHEAGHFVLCWYFGFPPMTVTISKTGHGITRSRKPIPVKPDQWRICLMGGYAAETLAMPPEQFLAYSDGLWGALKLPDRADTKKLPCTARAHPNTTAHSSPRIFCLNTMKSNWAMPCACCSQPIESGKPMPKASMTVGRMPTGHIFQPKKR